MLHQGLVLSTAKPISSPAGAGPEKPASVYQLIGGLFLLFSSSSSSSSSTHPLKGLGLLKTRLTLFSISKQMSRMTLWPPLTDRRPPGW